MKYVRLFLILLLLSFTVVVPNSAYANVDASKTPSNPLQAAKIHVLNDIKSDSDSGWKGGTVSITKPEYVFNNKNEVKGFLFNVKINGRDSGFVMVENSTEYPILSFSYEGAIFDQAQKNEIRGSIKGQIKNEEIIEISPAHFAIKFEMENGEVMIKGPRGQNVVLPHNSDWYNNRAPIIPKSVGEIGTNNDGVTDVNPDNWESGYTSVTEKKIANVPDMNQWKYDSTNWTGCAPTAGSNLMAYWAIKSADYDNLMPTNQSAIVFALRDTMGTTQDANGEGSTSIPNIDNGLQDYARNQGLSSATSSNYGNSLFGWDVSFDDYKNEINNGYPTLINVIGQTYYGEDSGHSVTGVGFKEYVYSSSYSRYFEMYDNWASTTGVVYMAYGRNYDNVYMTTFHPQ